MLTSSTSTPLDRKFIAVYEFGCFQAKFGARVDIFVIYITPSISSLEKPETGKDAISSH